LVAYCGGAKVFPLAFQCGGIFKPGEMLTSTMNGSKPCTAAADELYQRQTAPCQEADKLKQDSDVTMLSKN